MSARPSATLSHIPTLPSTLGKPKLSTIYALDLTSKSILTDVESLLTVIKTSHISGELILYLHQGGVNGGKLEILEKQ